MSIDNKNLSVLIKEYLKKIKSEKSIRTVSVYHDSLNNFFYFMGEVNITKIRQEQVNIDFRKYLTEVVQLSDISVAYALQHVRYFFEYAKELGLDCLEPNTLIDKVLIKSLKPNTREYKGDIIEENEAEKILNYWKNSSDASNPRGIRNQLIMDILWDTGMTVSELAMLTIDDINWQKATLNLHYKDQKKQHKNRQVTVSQNTLVWLKKYFDAREDDCQALIVAFEGWNPYIVHAWPLTPRSIQRMIHKTVSDLKIDKRISPSVFRSTRYTQLIRQGVPLTEINKIIGVSGTSRQYLKFSEKHRPQIPNNFVSIKEAAKEFNLTPNGLRLYLINHTIPLKKIWGSNYFDKQIFLKERIKQPQIPDELKNDYSTKKSIMEKFAITENILKYWLRKLKPETKLCNGKLYIKNSFINLYNSARKK